MTEVALDRQPWEAGGGCQLLHLVGLQRPANRQRAIVMQDGMERLGEQPGPDVGAPRPHEVVDDDAAGGEPIEGLQRADDLCVGEVVEEERAGDVVERVVAEWRLLDIGTDQAQPLIDRRNATSVVERAREDVGCGDAQVEPA